MQFNIESETCSNGIDVEHTTKSCETGALKVLNCVMLLSRFSYLDVTISVYPWPGRQHDMVLDNSAGLAGFLTVWIPYSKSTEILPTGGNVLPALDPAWFAPFTKVVWMTIGRCQYSHTTVASGTLSHLASTLGHLALNQANLYTIPEDIRYVAPGTPIPSGTHSGASCIEWGKPVYHPWGYQVCGIWKAIQSGIVNPIPSGTHAKTSGIWKPIPSGTYPETFDICNPIPSDTHPGTSETLSHLTDTMGHLKPYLRGDAGHI